MCPAERGDHTIHYTYQNWCMSQSSLNFRNFKLKLLKMKIINSISLFSLDLSMLSRAL